MNDYEYGAPALVSNLHPSLLKKVRSAAPSTIKVPSSRPRRRKRRRGVAARMFKSGKVPLVVTKGIDFDEEGVRGQGVSAAQALRMFERAWEFQPINTIQSSVAGVPAGVNLTAALPTASQNKVLVPGFEITISAPHERAQAIPFSFSVTSAYGENLVSTLDMGGTWNGRLKAPTARIVILGFNLINCQAQPQPIALSNNFAGGETAFAQISRAFTVNLVGLPTDYTATITSLSQGSRLGRVAMRALKRRR